LSPEELTRIQPGMARLMVEYSQRFWTLYYAGKAENWDLAHYMLREMRKLGEIIVLTRPKYAEAMREFQGGPLTVLEEAIRAKDWGKLEAAYRATMESSDSYHDKFGKPFIRFRLPDHPPEWLKMER